jgi:hypothetical protein
VFTGTSSLGLVDAEDVVLKTVVLSVSTSFFCSSSSSSGFSSSSPYAKSSFVTP